MTRDHSIIDAHLHGLADVARRTASTLADDISKVAAATHACLEAGGKLMYCGNGGSAADAQHIATEYVVRFQRNRTPMAAIALTTDTSLLTAASNDFSFENVFERQVQALGRAGDILFLHSTSGESANLLRAADAARVMGVTSIGLLARGGGRLASSVDIALIVPTDNGAHAQEMHLAISHTICQMVEHRFFGEP
jgi:D-sedoheptulose 7-phosphate isomerase